MDILKFVTIISLTFTISYAKIDFVKFGDICDNKLSKSCQNKSIEIKAIQYLLKKRVDSTINLNGKLDSKTKNAIISLQRKEHIPASGYIGKNTKDALNKLLYGHRLHIIKKFSKKVVAKKSIKVVKKVKIVKKDNTKKVASAKDKKRKVLTKKLNSSRKIVAKAKSSKKANIKLLVPKKSNKKAIKKSNKAELTKSTKTMNAKIDKKESIEFIPKTHQEFVRKINLRKSYSVYKDPKLLKSASARNSLLKVDISEQRIKLYVNGRIALDSPCTTGAKHKLEPNTRTYRDKHTPTGSFKIIEKIADKRSTIFGNLYRHGKLIYHGDRRKYKGSWRGVKYVGASLKRWMRLTSGGIGLHASNHIKRYPGSNGCIRIPPKVASVIFKKVTTGTKVKVVN